MNMEATMVMIDQITNSADTRWQAIRRTSNVIQALENLLVQCDDLPEFADMRAQAQEQLAFAREELRKKIHLS